MANKNELMDLLANAGVRSAKFNQLNRLWNNLNENEMVMTDAKLLIITKIITGKLKRQLFDMVDMVR